MTILCLAADPVSSLAEVVNVTITSQTIVADGQSFGSSGPYEKLVGRIEFALDPIDPHNKPIVDLQYAPCGTDGRVHFSSDLYVLRPSEPTKGSGVLFFEVANRGRKLLLSDFDRALPNENPQKQGDFGDGLLMREGCTLVWIGWEMDLQAPMLLLDGPQAKFPPESVVAPLSVEVIYNKGATDGFLIESPDPSGKGKPPIIYPPIDEANKTDRLTVRDHFWDEGTVIPREQWRFIAESKGVPKLRLDTGFEPGRSYRVTYQAANPVVAGVGLAAIRDAASAFRYRSDLPIHGQATFVYGRSQTGRFLRQFLHDGFNVDEKDRRVFDAIWSHIAGAAGGSFNERFAVPFHISPYSATTFPFTDQEQTDSDGARDGLQKKYRPDQRPKVFYTNTPVEYWGSGRAAALIHTNLDGKSDLTLPENVRVYFLAGTQHAVPAFPPSPVSTTAQTSNSAPAARADGQLPVNPTPQVNIMRGLFRAFQEWVAKDAPPPPSKYPRLGDKTLVSVMDNKFPRLSGVSDPRTIVGPARIINGKVTPLPFLVPQADADGNDLGGIRDPEVAVPLATTTGWNFRSKAVGNPSELYPLLGSYIPFAKTKADRVAMGDPRLSIGERYKDQEDYLKQIRSTATELIKNRYMLEEDLENVLVRAKTHWSYATGAIP